MTVDVLKQYMPGIREHGIVTDVTGTWSGIQAFTAANTHTGAETHSGAEVHTGQEIFSTAPIIRKNILASSGNTTMTAGMSGSVMLMDSATVDYTLPAIGASDIGISFDFVVTVTSTNQSITAGAADLLIGSMTFMDAATPLFDVFTPDVSDDLIFSTNGSTTGGLIGSCYTFTAISATRWWVSGFNLGSGAAATPFS